MNEVEILKNLISFNTIEDKENNKILNFIETYLKEYGFETIKKEKYLIMQLGTNVGVSFIGHSDTVELTEGWKTDPFEMTMKNGRIYGLGSCDMKGGIAGFLGAISEIDSKKLKKGIKVYITYDEEIGFNGILDVLKYEKEKMKESDLFIIGEPTYNEVKVGCKGLLGIQINASGIKVHSSTPEKGKSAISNMIKVLSELEKYYFSTIKVEEDFKYEVPYTTMNIGLLNGGSAKNSVAANASSYVDFRIINNKHIDMIKEKLDRLCKKYETSYDIDIEIKSFYNDIDYISSRSTAGFMTEASFIEGNRIILGPGPVTAHEVNEFIELESLEKVKNQYKELILKACK